MKKNTKKIFLYFMSIAAMTLAAEGADAQMNKKKKRQINEREAAFSEEMEDAMGRGKAKTASSQEGEQKPQAQTEYNADSARAEFADLMRRIENAEKELSRLQNEQNELRYLIRPAQPQYTPPAANADEGNAEWDKRFFEDRYMGWELRCTPYVGYFFSLPVTFEYCFNRYIQVGAGWGYTSFTDDKKFFEGHTLFACVRALYPNKYIFKPYAALHLGAYIYNYIYNSSDLDNNNCVWFSAAAGVQWVYRRFGLHAEFGFASADAASDWSVFPLYAGFGLSLYFGQYK